MTAPAPRGAPILATPMPMSGVVPAQTKPPWLIIAVAAVGVIIVGGGIWWWLSGALDRKFNVAVKNGRLTGNTGDSAYELYEQALREKGTNSRTVRDMNAKAEPVLRSHLDELFNRWYRESDLGESTRWSDVHKMAAWMAAIEPSNSEVLARATFAQAQAELLAGHFVNAEQLFRTALNTRPDWPVALNGVARACRNQRNFLCSEEFYRRAMQADPQWVFPHQNLAGLYMDLKRLPEAESEYQAAVRLDPNRAGSRFLMGQLYERERRPVEACGEYRAALSLVANQARAPFDRDLVSRRIQKVCR